MRSKLAKWIRKIAAKIDPPYSKKLWNRTLELIKAAESFENASGEYKRHRVYAQLIKDFPSLKKSDIAFLIEVVIQSS